MADFAKRLRWCLKNGNMTVADLKHWFDRPYATVRTWVFEAREPRGPSGNHAHTLLAVLERKIKRGLVIPATLSSNDRPDHIRKLRHDASATLPGARSAE